MSKSKGWIGVDLDGTLAEYNGWIHYTQIGNPIPSMIKKVKDALTQCNVKVFTARLCDEENKEHIIQVIQDWCEEHIGERLEVTNVKDFGMIELWDDRCRRVIINKGEFCCDN